MKKIMSFSFILFVILSLGVFVSCDSKTATAGSLTFNYKQNSALKTANENDESSVKLKLTIKNTSAYSQEVDAALFTLQNEDKIVSKSVFFGNNIIDAMDTETLQANKKEDFIVNINIPNDLVGKYDLYYNNTKLLVLNITNN